MCAREGRSMHQAKTSQSRRKRAALLLALAPFVAWLGPIKSANAEETLEPMLALIEWEHPFPAEVSYFRVHFSDTRPQAPDAGTAIAVGTPGARGRVGRRPVRRVPEEYAT